MNRSGFSMVEMSIATVLFAGVLFVALRGFKQMTDSGNMLENKGNLNLQLVIAAQFIQKVGRISQTCRKGNLAGLDTLDCNIDLNRPATGNLTWIRFVQVGNELQYQFDNNNDGAFTAVTRRVGYPDITNFTVCDDNDQNLGGGGTCAIQPTTISQFHTNNLLPLKVNRFFRFAISGQLTAANVQTAATGISSYQGAFYVRNPTPFGALGNVVYQW